MSHAMVALKALQSAYESFAVCPCCTAQLVEMNLCGCDCGSKDCHVGDHKQCKRWPHSVTEGCGQWSDWMSAVLEDRTDEFQEWCDTTLNQPAHEALCELYRMYEEDTGAANPGEWNADGHGPAALWAVVLG